MALWYYAYDTNTTTNSTTTTATTGHYLALLTNITENTFTFYSFVVTFQLKKIMFLFIYLMLNSLAIHLFRYKQICVVTMTIEHTVLYICQ